VKRSEEPIPADTSLQVFPHRYTCERIPRDTCRRILFFPLPLVYIIPPEELSAPAAEHEAAPEGPIKR
jgi:hypothetical protein